MANFIYILKFIVYTQVEYGIFIDRYFDKEYEDLVPPLRKSKKYSPYPKYKEECLLFKYC